MHHIEHTEAPHASTRGRRTAVVGTAIAALALSALPHLPASASGFSRPTRCEAGVCLRYDLVLVGADSDGDGFTDDDELAAGTDPKDPADHPAVLEVFDLAAAGGLPSFEKRLSDWARRSPTTVGLASTGTAVRSARTTSSPTGWRPPSATSDASDASEAASRGASDPYAESLRRPRVATQRCASPRLPSS